MEEEKQSDLGGMDTRLKPPGMLLYDIDTHLPFYYYSKELV